VAGKGAVVTLATGQATIDAAHSHALLGHAHPALRRALQAALDHPVVGDSGAAAPLEDTSETLAETVFSNAPWAQSIRFCTSGTEANEMALSLARLLTGRRRVACRRRSYHGGAGLAAQATSHPLYHGGLVSSRGVASPPTGGDVLDLTTGLAAEARELVDVAAVIDDWGSGLVHPSSQARDGLARTAKAVGALWIADEVVTAPGRLGMWLAAERQREHPDLLTLGKGITAGAVPGGAVVLSRTLTESLDGWSWQSIGTTRAHPLALAAMSTTAQVIAAEGLVVRAAGLGARLGSGIREALERQDSVRQVAGRGLMWSIELRAPARWRRWDGRPAGEPPAAVFARHALAAGALVNVYDATGISVTPPLVVREREVDTLVEALAAAATAYERSPPGDPDVSRRRRCRPTVSRRKG
jgi:acetylornithine/succinyldiaminopimelate/putrescine aminotransferase